MSSKEIAAARKKLEEDFRTKANLLTGELSEAKENFNLQLKELQKKCTHIWDTGESAIQYLENNISICTICRKKL